MCNNLVKELANLFYGKCSKFLIACHDLDLDCTMGNFYHIKQNIKLSVPVFISFALSRTHTHTHTHTPNTSSPIGFDRPKNIIIWNAGKEFR